MLRCDRASELRGFQDQNSSHPIDKANSNLQKQIMEIIGSFLKFHGVYIKCKGIAGNWE